jgi:hypothetical protein
MSVRSSFGAGVVLLAAGVLVSGCDRGGGVAPSANGGASAVTTSVDPAVAAQKAACAAFRDGVASTNTANQTYLNAVNDPKRVGNQYDKPTTDAVNAGAVILMYASDEMESAVTPQVPKELARKIMDFVQILQERASLYAQHASSDDLDANGKKYTPAATELLKECPAGSSDASPPKPAVAPASNPDAAKQGFCAVYSKQIQQTEDAKTRFAAATKGDEQHPDTQWKDPDQWLAGQAADAGIVFKYAVDLIEAQLVPQLSPDVADKGKTLVAAMRKLSKLYADRSSSDDRAAVFSADYGPAAESLDTICGVS